MASETYTEDIKKENIEKIKMLTKDHSGYRKVFIKFHLNENIPVSGGSDYWSSLSNMLEHIINKRQTIRNLMSTPPAQYDSFEKLADDLRKLPELDMVKKEFINELPSKLKEKDLIKNLSENDIAVIIEYLKKPQELFRPKHESNNIREHLEYIAGRLKILNNQTFSKLYNELTSEWKNIDDVELIYEKNNILVFRTINPLFIKKFGSQKWCIVYGMDHWFKNYVNPLVGNTQFIVFDFNQPLESQRFKYGITIDKYGNSLIGASQDNFNIGVPKNEIIRTLELPAGIFASHKYDAKTIEDFKFIYKLTTGEIKKISSQKFYELKDYLLHDGDAFVSSIQDAALFNLFIENNININIQDSSGNTILHQAIINNNHDVLNKVLSKNVDINIKNKTGDTPIMLA
jgi:hypothetical protein